MRRMSALTGWERRAQSPEDVLQHIQSGMRVFIHAAAATPTPLVDALAKRMDLEKVRLSPAPRRDRADRRAGVRGSLPLGLALRRRRRAPSNL